MKRLALLTAVLVAGCGPDATVVMKDGTKTTNGSFVVERVAVFEDDTAYNKKRGIYLITAPDGQQWVGVSGIGISERGSHAAGKNQRVEHEQ